jgi:hypothetical protein
MRSRIKEAPTKASMRFHVMMKSAATGAWFAPVSGAGPGAVRHYAGFPAELGGEDSRTFPPPAALLIEPLAEGGVFLTRLTADGDPVGDTWHENWDEAIEQARFEFGTRVGEWNPVPSARNDLEDYVAEQLKAWKMDASERSGGG